MKFSFLEPRCSRLLCTCTCRKRKELFNPAPYDEPGLLWPWNIKRNRHSGAFDMKDELLPREEIELNNYHRNSTTLNYNAIPKDTTDNTTNNKFNDFEPVVLFTPSKTPDSQCFASGNPQYLPNNSNKNNCDEVPQRNRAVPNSLDNRPSSVRYASTPSIIEKYFKSQEPYAQNNGYSNRFADDDQSGPGNVRDSIVSEQSLDFHQNPLRESEQNNKLPENPPQYKELYNENLEDPTKPPLPNYRDLVSALSDYSDAPRALFRKDGEPARKAKRNRKSLDSLLLKTLEDIEEQQILTNTSHGVNTPALERHVAIVRDALQKATRSFDSVSSTCSSSVGELRRAFDFGKKHGLQNYDIPVHLQESMDDLTVNSDDDDDDMDFKEHEKFLDNLVRLANFSEDPKSSNDIEVRIPLPVRLNDSDESEDDENETEPGGLASYI